MFDFNLKHSICLFILPGIACEDIFYETSYELNRVSSAELYNYFLNIREVPQIKGFDYYVSLFYIILSALALTS